MKYSFNLTGSDRKALIRALEDILEEKALYMPNCDYEVSYFIVTGEGALTCCDNADPDEVDSIVDALAEKGFRATAFSYDDDGGAPDCEADLEEPYEDCPPPYGTPTIEFPSREIIHRLRQQYPAGTRVRLVNMNDKYCVMPAGLLGTVYKVDDAGTIHIDWDNGSMLGVVYGVDEIEKEVSE